VPGEDTPALFALASLGTYALAPPFIHVGNGQPVRGLTSAAVRVGFPIVGFGAGVVAAQPACASSHEGDTWGCVGAVVVLGGLGVLLGGVAAIIVDDAFLGKVELPRPATARTSFRMSVVPLADPKRRSLGFSVAGTF
jgi:hypothetical protein